MREVMSTAWRRWGVVAALVLGVVALPRMDFVQARGLAVPRSLAGNWGFFFVGQAVSTQQPESGIGVAVLDDQGGIAGTETFNTGFQLCEVTLTGRYSVAPNGTGRMTIGAASPIPSCDFSFDAAFVVLEGGNVLKLVGTEPGFVIINEEWRRRPEY